MLLNIVKIFILTAGSHYGVRIYLGIDKLPGNVYTEKRKGRNRESG